MFLPPIIVSVVCPTDPHPPLRLARRPNRGHVTKGGLHPSCGTCLWSFSSRAGCMQHSPPSSTTKVDALVLFTIVTKPAEFAPNFPENRTSPGRESSCDNLAPNGVHTYFPPMNFENVVHRVRERRRWVGFARKDDATSSTKQKSSGAESLHPLHRRCCPAHPRQY